MKIASIPFLDFTASPRYTMAVNSEAQQKEEKMENLWLVLFWSGPIGIGIFLVCLGIFIWLLSKDDAVKKSACQKE